MVRLGALETEGTFVEEGSTDVLIVKEELAQPVAASEVKGEAVGDTVDVLDTGDAEEFAERLGVLVSEGRLVEDGGTDALVDREELTQLDAVSELEGETVGETVDDKDLGDAVEFMERLGVLVSEVILVGDGGIELLGVTLELTEFEKDTEVVGEIDGDVLAELAALSDRVEFTDVKLVREDVRNAVFETKTDSVTEVVAVFDTFEDAELKNDGLPDGEAEFDGSFERMSTFDLVGDREPDSDVLVVDDADGEFDEVGLPETVADAEAQEDDDALMVAATEELRVPNALGEMVEFDENEYELEEVNDTAVLLEAVMERVSIPVFELTTVSVASIDGDDELCKDVLSV